MSVEKDNAIKAIKHAFIDLENRWNIINSQFRKDGDAVVMYQSNLPLHVGLVVDGGDVLHSMQGCGVIVNSLSHLKTQFNKVEIRAYTTSPV